MSDRIKVGGAVLAAEPTVEQHGAVVDDLLAVEVAVGDLVVVQGA